MKSFIALTFATSLLADPNGVYVEIGAGQGFGSIETKGSKIYLDAGYVGSLAIGYQANIYRIELEENYKKDSVYSFDNVSASGDYVRESKMINIYLSAYNDSNLVSSIGGGVGISDISLKNLQELERVVPDLVNNGVLTFDGSLSIGYMVTTSITATVKYTYFYTQKSDNFDSNGNSTFTFGLRYVF